MLNLQSRSDEFTLHFILYTPGFLLIINNTRNCNYQYQNGRLLYVKDKTVWEKILESFHGNCFGIFMQNDSYPDVNPDTRISENISTNRYVLTEYCFVYLDSMETVYTYLMINFSH